MIYSARGDGLGTRVLSAVYAQMLSELIQIPLRVIWPPLGGDLYANYSLMHPDHVLEIFDDLHVFRGPDGRGCAEIVLPTQTGALTLASLSQRPSEFHHLTPDEVARKARVADGILYDFPAPLFAFMHAGPDLGPKTARTASRINWHRDVRAAIDRIDARFAIGRCVAVHVRRGDLVDLMHRSDLDHLVNDGMMQILQRYTPLDAFFEQVDRCPGQNIIVCTEDDDVIEGFRRRYGVDRIASCAPFALTENQRAAADLLLLSRAQRIIAPRVSFFSRCAASIGDTALRNTEWHLAGAIADIERLLEGQEAERVRQVSAVLYGAAYVIARAELPEQAADVRARGLAFDAPLFDRVANR